MKVIKIESLKKNVYLIDGYDDEHDAYYYMSDCPILKRYRCLGKLKDLTESDCEPLVEKGFYEGTFNNYKRLYTHRYRSKKTAKESFLSALEASGLHLNGNPYKNPKNKIYADNEFDKYNDDLDIYHEAEQNVFSENTIVFYEDRK